MNTIELIGFQKEYTAFSVKHLSFSVPKGYITGFIGHNGAGKTTTLKAILNCLGKYEGRILYNGKDTREDLSYLSDIGIIMDESFLAKDWTVKTAEKAMRIGYQKWESDTFFRLSEKFGLDQKQKVKELSRGMKIKLMLATALSHGAKTLIMDEPTSGMDPYMRSEFCDILQDFVSEEDKTVLFSTHITTDLENIADHIIHIKNGEKIYEGAKDDFIENYLIVKGAREELKGIDRDILIGTRTYENGFEAMTERKFEDKLPESLVKERASIDKIMVFSNRG